MEHFIISGLNEQQTLVCLIVAAFAFIGAAEYLIGLRAAKSGAPAFVPAFWQSGDGDGGCGNRVVKCDLMSARSGSVSAAKATSGKKFTRVTSSHVSYSGEELKKLRAEFNRLKNQMLTQGKLSPEQQRDYERTRQILAHYGLKV